MIVNMSSCNRWHGIYILRRVNTALCQRVAMIQHAAKASFTHLCTVRTLGAIIDTIRSVLRLPNQSRAHAGNCTWLCWQQRQSLNILHNNNKIDSSSSVSREPHMFNETTPLFQKCALPSALICMQACTGWQLGVIKHDHSTALYVVDVQCSFDDTNRTVIANPQLLRKRCRVQHMG